MRTDLGLAPSPEAVQFGKPAAGWRRRWFSVIYESETPGGRRFNVALLVVILASVLVVILESVPALALRFGPVFHALEWAFTVLFSVEYLARLACAGHPVRYARSFFGLVDLGAVLPMYLATFAPGLRVLIDIRVLRMLRAFRILKLTAYLHEYSALADALRASRRKILVFLSAVAMIVVLLGTVMYAIEGPQHGFTSIPMALYWAMTTLTTIGTGDLAPRTDLGRAISSVVMLIGWGILAVPTGIVTAEMTGRRFARPGGAQSCGACGSGGHVPQARFCHHCGAPLARPEGVTPP